MMIVVGLGNPGDRYRCTRHNVGFKVVDEMARRQGISWRLADATAYLGDGLIAGRRLLVVKPLTYMNRSGIAVRQVLHRWGASAADMIVVHDDLDLPVGRIRVVRGGGAGGHRGVGSIIEHLGDKAFPRVKLGIGRPLEGEAIEEFVLAPPYPRDLPRFRAMIMRAADAVETVIDDGVEVAMNVFNRRFQPGSEKTGESKREPRP